MDSLFEIDFYFNFIACRYYIIQYVIQKDQILTLLLYFYFY